MITRCGQTLMRLQAYAPYFRSLAELANAEQHGKTHIGLDGLRKIAHRFGHDSEEFVKAKEMMRLSVDVRLSQARCARSCTDL